ncbi:hypothetical protein PYW08_013042 [Mythimna loreyi]|uniref:Uncharacterized protein n=1 Tax=Mythimna loreyi TaxID=667449 RepID=A0ACC2PYX8_9NEOP|nr:hypothetical protein PYW08_013042 [Mythimna loreyi]
MLAGPALVFYGAGDVSAGLGVFCWQLVDGGLGSVAPAALAAPAAAATVVVAPDHRATNKLLQIQGAPSGSLAAEPRMKSQAESEHVTDGEPSPDTQLTLREEIRLFRSELRKVRDEMREFHRDMSGLQSTVVICTERVDSLEARIEALETRQSAALPDAKVTQLEELVSQLHLELNDREQDLFSSDLEIANIPEIPGENVVHTVGLVAAKLGLTLEDRNIVFAQRVSLRAEQRERQAAVAGGTSPAAAAAARGRRIVVRLTRRSLRDELLQGAHLRRGATTADLVRGQHRFCLITWWIVISMAWLPVVLLLQY